MTSSEVDLFIYLSICHSFIIGISRSPFPGSLEMTRRATFHLFGRIRWCDSTIPVTRRGRPVCRPTFLTQPITTQPPASWKPERGVETPRRGVSTTRLKGVQCTHVPQGSIKKRFVSTTLIENAFGGLRRCDYNQPRRRKRSEFFFKGKHRAVLNGRAGPKLQ